MPFEDGGEFRTHGAPRLRLPSASLRSDGKSSALAVDDTAARIGFRSKCVARFPIDRLRLMIDRASLVAWRTGDLTKMWASGPCDHEFDNKWPRWAGRGNRTLTISNCLYKLQFMEIPLNLDFAFAALADPTRRAILARLAKGEATVMELAGPFEMTQPAISQHLKVLEGAGLIATRVDGTKRPRRLAKAGIDAMDQWLAMLRKATTGWTRFSPTWKQRAHPPSTQRGKRAGRQHGELPWSR
jgi:DNA-binding transcriptional ArsR family regulator